MRRHGRPTIRIAQAAAIMSALVALTSCTKDNTPVGAQRSAGPQIVPVAATAAIPVASASPYDPYALYLHVGNGIVVANPAITPGHAVAGTTVATVCKPGFGIAAHRARYKVRAAVYASYDVAWSDRANYQDDELIPPELGGDDTQANVWPMPLAAGLATPALKAALTSRLHTLVCAKKLTLAAAQSAIATNWWAAYQQYANVPITPIAVTGKVCPLQGATAQSKNETPLLCEKTPTGILEWTVAPRPPGSASHSASASASLSTKKAP
jgi:hypothetical protein